MRCVATRRRGGPRRSGKYLILLWPVLPVLLGMTGLTIDAGSLLAVRRQAQNLADAAALAAAQDLWNERSPETATATAIAMVHADNGLPRATVAVQIPPLAGPFEGDGRYAEVTVTAPMRTSFIQIVGIDPNQTVAARAVAGSEAAPLPFQVTLLDSGVDTGIFPGLRLDGIPLSVAGRIAVNSEGAGRDENGQEVDLGSPEFAGRVGGPNGQLTAPDVRVVGGVDHPENFLTPDGPGSSLHAGQLPVVDPISNLPTPTVANGVKNVNPDIDINGVPQSSAVNANIRLKAGDNVILKPGIYTKPITIQQGDSTSRVTFQPGIYVLKGGTSRTLLIQTNAQITGNGVLFYNTGKDYDPTTGGPDTSDFGPPPKSNSSNFGAINIRNSQNIHLTGLNDASSPFNGLLIYQRRWNPLDITFSDLTTTSSVSGAIYAKWGGVRILGPGNYPLQVVAGRMGVFTSDLAGTVQLNPPPNPITPAQVYLVE